MASTTTDRRRTLTVEPSEISGAFVRATLEASRNWTGAYLDGLEKAVDLQLQLAQSYASVGEQYVNAATALLDRADRAGSGDTTAVANTIDRAAKSQAETTKAAANTVNRAAKRQAETTKAAAKTVDRAAKAQTERVTGPTEEPFPGYDELTAEQITEKLPTVSQRTLTKVGAYERAHDARTTVLSRIESLTAKEPVAGYDDLTVAEIEQRLSAGDQDAAKRVRDYERAHSARNGVLQAAERQLKQS